jgi:hypothetical protein
VEKWDNFAFRLPAITSRHTFRSRSGSLAMLAAMRLASSLVSRSAAVRRPGSFSKTEVGERGGDAPSCGVGASCQLVPAVSALPLVDTEVGQDKNPREQETVQRRHAVEIRDADNG